MKRQTFIEYAKVISISLIITAVTSVFGVVSCLLDAGKKQPASSVVDESANFTVVIDAGHGGEDGGAVGKGGSLEKQINLSIAGYLYDLFSLTDINAVMTRSGDCLMYREGQESRKKFYDLSNRLEVCMSFEKPVLISIHQNKFPLEKYKGLQVYYSQSTPFEKNLADIIQSRTQLYLQRDNNRKTKAAGRNIFILDKATFPAVLVECGFLSNPEDEANLNNPDYQKKIAFIIFSSAIECMLDYGGNS